jgi:hypothetical protein
MKPSTRPNVCRLVRQRLGVLQLPLAADETETYPDIKAMKQLHACTGTQCTLRLSFLNRGQAALTLRVE